MSKNSRVTIRTNEEILKSLNCAWKDKLRPHPNNSRKAVPFKSRNEYLEYLLDLTNQMTRDEFWTLSSLCNPERLR